MSGNKAVLVWSCAALTEIGLGSPVFSGTNVGVPSVLRRRLPPKSLVTRFFVSKGRSATFVGTTIHGMHGGWAKGPISRRSLKPSRFFTNCSTMNLKRAGVYSPL